MRLVLLGAPGSGKGTQGQRLARYYGVPHVATGDIIRDHIARRTEFGRKVETAIAAGNFAPDEDILYWVSQRLREADAANGYILDGFPRDLAQALAWDQRAGKIIPAFDAVVELVISLEALIFRLSGRLICPVDDEIYHVVLRPPHVPGHCDQDGAVLIRRPDDEPDAIRHRMQIYEQRTLPLRDYYRTQGILCSIPAEGTPDEICVRIVSVLQGLKSASLEV